MSKYLLILTKKSLTFYFTKKRLQEKNNVYKNRSKALGTNLSHRNKGKKFLSIRVGTLSAGYPPFCFFNIKILYFKHFYEIKFGIVLDY